MYTFTPWNFPDRDRFSGQERFIDGNVVGGEEDPVRRDPVTFNENEHIAGYHFAASNPFLFTVTDHQRTGT
jgi:hypothetical protein